MLRNSRKLLSNIVSSSEGDIGLSLAVDRPVEKVLFIVITSDRGLAGAYNANVIKLAKTTIREKYASQQAKGNVSIWINREKRVRAFRQE